MITVQCGWCDKVSPKPGLELFREDYKSVEETCLAVGFVKNNCKNDSKTSKTSESITFFFYKTACNLNDMCICFQCISF